MTLMLTDQQLASIESEAKENGVLAEYRKLVKKGESPRMALMIVTRGFPGMKGTDTKFQKLERERVREISDEDMTKIHRIAKRAGISTTGKTYNGALGAYDDPRAWISDTHDVKAAAKAKGLSLRGQVNVENEVKPVKPVPLSERIINETARDYMEADPALKERVKKNPKLKKELREKIIEKHAPKSKRSSLA